MRSQTETTAEDFSTRFGMTPCQNKTVIKVTAQKATNFTHKKKQKTFQ